MPLDPSISLGVKTVEMPNMLAQYGQLAQIQSAQQQNQLQQMQMAEYARARQEEEGARNYLVGKDLNAPATQSGLLQFGKTGLEYSKQLQAQQTAALQQKSAQLKYNADLAEQAGRIYLGVKDQASWDAARPKLAALGGDPSKLPEAYDPNYVASEIGQAVAVKDQWTATQPKLEQIKAGDKILFKDTNPRSPTFGKEMMPSQVMGVTPGEALAHQDRQRRLEQEMAMGTLSPESVDFAAQMYYQTGTMPPLGLGRNAAQARDQVIKRAAQIATGAGTESPVSAEEGAAKVVGNKLTLGTKTAAARTLGTTGAAMTLGANEASQMIPIAQQYVAKLNPSDYPALNQAGMFVAKNTGDPTQAGLAASLNALVNSYSRAISPTGRPTVSDKNHAREIINTAMSRGQFGEVFNVMQQEMQAAQKSLTEVTPGNIGKLTTTTPVPATAANVVVTPDGMTHTFPNAQAAANFKKAAGL